MKRMRYSYTLLAVLFVALAFASVASAQASRTWVSGVGDDANPCSRTAPCKTFAGAISKTAPGGEIDCLDPGGFGGVTITKAMTINCAATLGSVLVAGSPGITVAAGGSDVVNLLNLEIQGVGSGTNGINYISGKMLNLENVTIYGFTTAGVTVGTSTFSQLRAHNVLVSNCPTGFAISSSAGTAFANLSNVVVTGISGNAIQAGANASVLVRDSTLSFSGIAFNQTGASSGNLNNCQVTNNATAVQSSAGAAIGLFGNTFISNSTALNPNSGTIYTDGNNEFAGNSANGVANGGNPGFKM